MKKTTFLIVACLIVAGCEKPKPDPQPSTPHIDWAPEATAAQREMIVDMLNDMIYVEPNKSKSVKSSAFYTFLSAGASILSLITAVVSIVAIVTR